MGAWDLSLMVGDVRLARDETDGTKVMEDLTWTTTDQGGPATMSCSLLRSMTDDGTEQIFDGVSVIGPGGGKLHDWRLQSIPRSQNRRVQKQTPTCVGLIAKTMDNAAARWLGIDRDLGHWKGPTIPRRLAVSGAFKAFDHNVDAATLRLGVDGYAWAAAGTAPLIEAWYDAGALTVGTIYGGFQSTGKYVLTADLNFVVNAIEASDPDITTGIAVSSNLNPGTGTTAVVPFALNTHAKRMVGLQFRYIGGAGGSTAHTYILNFSDLVPVGDHGLPLTGTSAATYGIKASDALAYLIPKFGNGLRAGQIVDSGIGIPQLAFLSPTTLGEGMIPTINAVNQWAYGVWTDGLFDYYPHGMGRSRTWHVNSFDPGVLINDDGADGAQLWTDIVVSYRTASGEERSVGPPGSICHTEYAELANTNPANPAVASGDRRCYHFDLGFPAFDAVAVATGVTMLGQFDAYNRSGTATIRGMVRDEAGNYWPSFMVNGGDALIVDDSPDLTPRRIRKATYAHAQHQVDLTLDNAVQTADSMISLIGARQTGAF